MYLAVLCSLSAKGSHPKKKLKKVENVQKGEGGMSAKNKKNYETYNNERKKKVFASNSKFKIKDSVSK